MRSRYILSSIAFLLFTTQLATTASSQIKRNAFEFGYVKSDYDWAGESVWLANTKLADRIPSKSIASLRAEGLGKVNINGDDYDLKIVKSNVPSYSNFKVGRGGYQIWKGNGVTLRIDYVITKMCEPMHDDCIIYYYKGTMNVTYQGKRRKVKITGFGGS